MTWKVTDPVEQLKKLRAEVGYPLNEKGWAWGQKIIDDAIDALETAKARIAELEALVVQFEWNELQFPLPPAPPEQT